MSILLMTIGCGGVVVVEVGVMTFDNWQFSGMLWFPASSSEYISYVKLIMIHNTG